MFLLHMTLNTKTNEVLQYAIVIVFLILNS